MSESAQQIVDRLFERARNDAVAAPLASGFERAYRTQAWSAKDLEHIVDQHFVADNSEAS